MKKGVLLIMLLGTIVFTACSNVKENNNSDVTEKLETTENNNEADTEKLETTENNNEADTEKRIEKTEIIDFMRDYSINVINDDVRIYFWHVGGNTSGFRNFDEDCDYIGSNQASYELYFYANYDNDKESLRFGMLLGDNDINDINASSIVFDNGTESIKFISSQFNNYYTVITMDILDIKDNSTYDEIIKWKDFFKSDTIEIIIKQATGVEFTLELTDNTIKGVRGELDILIETMKVAY